MLNLIKGGHSEKRIFLSSPIKVYIEFSYSLRCQPLKCILSQEISLQRSPKFGIGSRHFEPNAQRPRRARPPSEMSYCSRYFALARVFVMPDLQLYCFEPECIPNPGDMRKRKRRSKRSYFGVLVRDVKSCQRKENVLVAENSQRQKTKWKVKF